MARRLTIGLLLTVTLCLCAFAGYQRLFSSFAAYDDEGYIMLSLFHFLDGEPLYDKTFSQYGPAYYFVQAMVHAVTDWPITHDVVRFKTLACWLMTAALAGGLIGRMTRSKPLSVAGGLFCFFHLERLAMEPGHPQGLCVLLITAALFATTFVRRERSWIVLLLGFLVGTVCMTKLNVGVFLAGGLLLAIVSELPRSGINKWFARAVLALALALPAILMQDMLFSAGGMPLGGIVLCSTLAVSLTVSQREANLKFARDACPAKACRGFFAGGSLAVVGWSLAAMAHGTSLAGLIDGIMLQHAGFAATFFTVSPVSWFAVFWAVLGLCLAISAARGNQTAGLVAQAVLVVIAVLVGGRHLAESFAPLLHGMQDRGGALLLIGCGTPFVWAILLRVPIGLSGRGNESRVAQKTGTFRSARSGGGFPRAAVCLVAALQPLGIFPTPGTQTAIASVAILLAAVVAVADWVEHGIVVSVHRRRRPLMATGFAVLLLVTLLARDIHLCSYRRSLTPLALPGADRLRLPAEEALRHRWLTDALSANADSFLFRYNGMNSYYFWTQTPPPTAVNATCWPALFDDRRQQNILAAVRDQRRLCVVREHQDWPAEGGGPLVAYLDGNFEPCIKRNHLEIWCRRSPLRAGVDQ